MDLGLQQLGQSLLVYNSQLALVSNNLANTVTDRYKRDSLTVQSFSDYYIQEEYKSEKKYQYSINTYTDFSQGEIYKTKENDFAIDGRGFIRVEHNGIMSYSRGGSYQVDQLGYLRDQHGGFIQGRNGNIFLGDDGFILREDGSLVQNNIVVDQILLYDFFDYNDLSKSVLDYYVSEQDPIVANDSLIRAGHSEKSNVNMSEEYLKMMDISRKFETSQTVIQIMDEMKGKIINGIAVF